jgi:c-di-GMP-binding flagellar brake protein YcgR
MDNPSGWKSSPVFGGRRRFARHRLESRLLVTEAREGLARAVQGRIRDLSEGGLGCFVAGDLEPGQIVLVEFPLPKSRQDLVLRARVLRHATSHYGFEFLQVSPAVLEEIRAACEDLPAI